MSDGSGSDNCGSVIYKDVPIVLDKLGGWDVKIGGPELPSWIVTGSSRIGEVTELPSMFISFPVTYRMVDPT